MCLFLSCPSNLSAINGKSSTGENTDNTDYFMSRTRSAARPRFVNLHYSILSKQLPFSVFMDSQVLSFFPFHYHTCQCSEKRTGALDKIIRFLTLLGLRSCGLVVLLCTVTFCFDRGTTAIITNSSASRSRCLDRQPVRPPPVSLMTFP